MKTEVQPYYRNGKLVKGYFRKGKPDLVPPDKFMIDYCPQKKEEFLP